MGYFFFFFALKNVKLEEKKIKAGWGKNLRGRKLSLVYLKSVGS